MGEKVGDKEMLGDAVFELPILRALTELRCLARAKNQRTSADASS